MNALQSIAVSSKRTSICHSRPISWIIQLYSGIHRRKAPWPSLFAITCLPSRTRALSALYIQLVVFNSDDLKYRLDSYKSHQLKQAKSSLLCH